MDIFNLECGEEEIVAHHSLSLHSIVLFCLLNQMQVDVNVNHFAAVGRNFDAVLLAASKLKWHLVDRTNSNDEASLMRSPFVADYMLEEPIHFPVLTVKKRWSKK